MERHIASLLANVSFFTLIGNVDDDRVSLLARLLLTLARNMAVTCESKRIYKIPRMLAFMGIFVCKLIHWNARNDRDVAQEQSDEAESRLFLVFAGNVRPRKPASIPN